jgi:hypothetical protein
MPEGSEGGITLAKFEESFAESGDRVFVLGVEDQSFLERTTCPRVFLAGMMSIAHADVKLDGVGVNMKAFSKYS